LDSIVIALIGFLCVFGGAVIGMRLRVILPDYHLDATSTDVVKLVMGLIGTMSALVLGLLIASAKTSYGTQRAYVVQLSADIVELDRVLARYGPETKEARHQLRQAVIREMERIWPKDRAMSSNLQVPEVAGRTDEFYDSLQILSPKTSGQQFALNQAMQISTSILHTRALMYEQMAGSISIPILVVLVSWLVLLFVGFGLLARLNGTVIAALLVGAMSVAGALFLILELYEPYGGLMRISSAPIVSALTQIGQ
jgi:hypothetical protein